MIANSLDSYYDPSIPLISKLLSHKRPVCFHNFTDAVYMNSQELLKKYAAGDRDFSSSNLSKVTLHQAELNQANFVETDFSRASLTGVNLSHADLRGANFTGADLSDANLSEADLRDAYLGAAILFRANLTGAKLNGANLRWASLINVVPKNLDLSDVTLDRTILPSGGVAE